LTVHFIHIPWPQSDYWHVFAGALAPAMCTKDCSRTTSSVFHTERVGSGNFLHSCEDILGAEVDVVGSTVTHDGRTTLVTSHPIGVDPAEFDELHDDPDVLEQERSIVEAAAGVSHRGAFDRGPDPSKNIVRGLFVRSRCFLDLQPGAGRAA